MAAPSIAYRDGRNKWSRTQLSISEDGEFGYNRSAIDLYLRICHDYQRKQESLAAVAATFGYKSRIAQIAGQDQDTVESVAQLADAPAAAAREMVDDQPSETGTVEAGFRTPSRNIACQVVRDDRRHVLRCSIRNFSGPRPSECRDPAMGGAFELVEGGQSGRQVCPSGGAEAPTLKELGYGATFRTGEFSCRSEMAGLTCTNGSKNGFYLSRDRQRVF